MGITPATGTEIAMSCVYEAFGLTPVPGANIGLNSTLGANRQPPQALGVSAIPASTVTTLSSDMGGLDTPQNYVCSGTLYYTLNGCTGQPLFDTTITPLLANQRYTDSVSGGFWVWDNAAGTSLPQQTVSGTIVRVTGQSGCP